MREKKTYSGARRRARGVTLTALSSRIFEFKGKYLPRYRRWRMRTLLLLALLVLTVLAIAVIYVRGLPENVARPNVGPEPSQEPPAPTAPDAAPGL